MGAGTGAASQNIGAFGLRPMRTRPTFLPDTLRDGEVVRDGLGVAHVALEGRGRVDGAAPAEQAGRPRDARADLRGVERRHAGEGHLPGRRVIAGADDAPEPEIQVVLCGIIAHHDDVIR
jgi:hypothetical protein